MLQRPNGMTHIIPQTLLAYSQLLIRAVRQGPTRQSDLRTHKTFNNHALNALNQRMRILFEIHMMATRAGVTR